MAETYLGWLAAFNGDPRQVGMRGVALVIATLSIGLGLGFRIVIVVSDWYGGLTLPKIVFVVPTLLVGGVFFVLFGYVFYRLPWLLGLPLALACAGWFGQMFLYDVSLLF